MHRAMVLIRKNVSIPSIHPFIYGVWLCRVRLGYHINGSAVVEIDAVALLYPSYICSGHSTLFGVVVGAWRMLFAPVVIIAVSSFLSSLLTLLSRPLFFTL